MEQANQKQPTRVVVSPQGGRPQPDAGAAPKKSAVATVVGKSGGAAKPVVEAPPATPRPSVLGDSPFGSEDANVITNPDPLEALDDDKTGISEDDSTDTMESGIENMSVLAVPYRKCLRCLHLCPELEKKEKRAKAFPCTAANGNDNCPAGFVRIVIALPYARIAASLVDAEEDNNSAEIARLHAKIATCSPEQKARIFDEVKNERAQRQNGGALEGQVVDTAVETGVETEEKEDGEDAGS